ncbi:ESCRT-II complex subunit [Plectosphaerella cucumerina]|uniref:ESCRT-II complex subunit VPS25 n=1 Tax=Plectosphaerella cucumerina TaxID=40658 RepID=A0A8K0X5R6_9PEZI|nr:ESCRT-II complex subunit [Plectosphaerella cucumerina]
MAQPTPFTFPREYSFPPFFTRQTNLTTHHAQLTKWSDLILSYCRHYRIFKLSLGAAVPASTTTTSSGPTATSTFGFPIYGEADAAVPSSGGSRTAEELFHNKKLNKRLSLADARDVIEFMRKDGRAEYVGAGGSQNQTAGDLVWIYWRTPEEWAALVEAWVDETGQKGVVLTLYELTEGDNSKDAEFHGLDQDLLLKALTILSKRGKAQIFGQEDSQGVKFF